MHILADIKTGKIQDSESLQSTLAIQRKKFVPLVKEASKKKKNKIAKVYGDSAYDASQGRTSIS